MGSIDKIINNVIDIVEMGSSMIWSDLKSMSVKIIKVLRVVENDKLSNGMNTRVISDEEMEARERQLMKLKMMNRVFQDPTGLSKLTTGRYHHNSVSRDENGFPMELHSKDLKSKFGK
jgi:hypothetical protein